LKWILERQDGVIWIDLAQHRDNCTAFVHTVMKHRVIKCWEILEQLFKCRLLKKGSAPCNK
jgi:hypothetical protein